MHALISESAAMLRRLLPPEVRVRVDVPRHPVVLHGCGDMLRQAILHAAARAWKQVRDGGELLISLAPPDSGQLSVPGGWLRLSMSHEAESSMRRAFVPEAESVHFAAMQALIGEHGGVVSEHPLPGGRRLDFLLPVRSEPAHHGDAAQFDEHATARHTLDRWLLLVSNDTRVQQRVAEALVATGWSLVTVPSLNCPQTRPDFGSMAEQRPSGVIIDLATARPDQLPAQLASACRDLPCLVVGGERGQPGFKSDVSGPPLPGTLGAFTQANDGRRDAESKRRGGEQPPSMPFAGEPSRRAHAHTAPHNTGSPTAQYGNSVDHPLDRQVVQRWVDQLTRVNPAASSIESPTTNTGPHTGNFFGGLR
jgi:hypothetical protein